MNTLRNQRRISLVAWAQDFMNARKFGGNKSLSGKKKRKPKTKNSCSYTFDVQKNKFHPNHCFPKGKSFPRGSFHCKCFCPR